MPSTCSHPQVEDSRCTSCGRCVHEVVLNGACYFCGATDVETTVKPAEPLVPPDSLVRHKK